MEWRNPFGDLRVTFQLKNQRSKLRTCFKAKSYYTLAKISLENPEKLHPKDIGGALQPLMVFNGTIQTMEREICIDTDDEPLTLYLQAQSDLNSRTIGQVELEYDVEWKLSKYSVDDLEGRSSLKILNQTFFYNF